MRTTRGGASQGHEQLELAQFYLAANAHLGELASPTRAEVKGFVVVYSMHKHVLAALMVPMTGVG